MKENQIIRTLLVISCLTLLSACSHDVHKNYIGIWAQKDLDAHNVVKILNDDGDYKMLSNLLNKDKQSILDLIKDGDDFLVQYKKHPAVSIKLSNNTNEIIINEKIFSKITDTELEELKIDWEIYKALRNDELIGDWLQEAIQEYHLDTGSFPKELNDLIHDTGNKMWLGPYIKASALTDYWGNPFFYELSEKSFILMALGKDNKKGGSGINADYDFSE